MKTPLPVALDKLRRIASSQERQMEQSAAERIFRDIGWALIDIGDFDAAWSLAQAVSPVPGGLDSQVLRSMREGGLRFLPLATLDPKERCKIAQKIDYYLWYKGQAAQATAVAAVPGCPASKEIEGPPPSVPSVAAQPQPPQPTAIDLLRQKAHEVCSPPDPGCFGLLAAVLAHYAVKARSEGHSSEAADILAGLPDRSLRIAAMSDVASQLAGPDSDEGLRYLGLTLSDVWQSNLDDRRRAFYRFYPALGQCPVRSLSGGVRRLGVGRDAVTLGLEEVRYCEIATRDIGDLILVNAGIRYALSGNRRAAGQVAEGLRLVALKAQEDEEPSATRFRGASIWSAIAALFLAADRPSDAADALHKMRALTRSIKDVSISMTPWLVMWGDGTYAKQVLSQGLSTAAFNRAWIVGAVLKADREELDRALSTLTDGQARTDALAVGLNLAACMGVPRSQAIAIRAEMEFRDRGEKDGRYGDRLARALRWYGASGAAQRTAKLFLQRAIATDEAAVWVDWRLDVLWAVVDSQDWGDAPDLRELLQYPRTTDGYLRTLSAIVKLLLVEKRYVELAAFSDLLHRADSSSPSIRTMWREIALAYAWEGDLATSFDALSMITRDWHEYADNDHYDVLERFGQSEKPRPY